MEDLFNAGYKREQVLDALRILPVVSTSAASAASSVSAGCETIDDIVEMPTGRGICLPLSPTLRLCFLAAYLLAITPLDILTPSTPP